MARTSNMIKDTPDVVVPTDKVSIDSIIKNYSKKFGENQLVVGSKVEYHGEVIPTGSLLLDTATGIGGIPVGRVIEIYGKESSGKTTICLTIIAQAQKMGKICAYVDTENSYDRTWAETLGINSDELIIVQPKSIEDALEKSNFLLGNGVDLVVFDSVASAPTIAELEGEIGDSTIGVKARILGQALRIMTKTLEKNNSTIIFINQTRQVIGGVKMPGMPAQTTTPGGDALKFACTLRIKTSRKKIDTKAKGTIGDVITAKLEKNKVGPPWRTAVMTLMYGRGFDRREEMYEVGVNLGLIQTAGSWSYPIYKDPTKQFKLNGKEAFIGWLEENPEEYKFLESVIREKAKNAKVVDLGIVEGDIEDADDE